MLSLDHLAGIYINATTSIQVYLAVKYYQHQTAMIVVMYTRAAALGGGLTIEAWDVGPSAVLQASVQPQRVRGALQNFHAQHPHLIAQGLCHMENMAEYRLSIPTALVWNGVPIPHLPVPPGALGPQIGPFTFDLRRLRNALL